MWSTATLLRVMQDLESEEKQMDAPYVDERIWAAFFSFWWITCSYLEMHGIKEESYRKLERLMLESTVLLVMTMVVKIFRGPVKEHYRHGMCGMYGRD